MRISDWSSDVCSSDLLGADSAVVTLLIGARDMMVEGMRGDLRAKVIDPFDPMLRQYLIMSMGSLPIEVLRILFPDRGRRPFADEQLQHGTLAHDTKSVVQGKSDHTCRSRWMVYTIKK